VIHKASRTSIRKSPQSPISEIMAGIRSGESDKPTDPTVKILKEEAIVSTPDRQCVGPRDEDRDWMEVLTTSRPRNGMERKAKIHLLTCRARRLGLALPDQFAPENTIEGAQDLCKQPILYSNAKPPKANTSVDKAGIEETVHAPDEKPKMGMLVSGNKIPAMSVQSKVESFFKQFDRNAYGIKSQRMETEVKERWFSLDPLLQRSYQKGAQGMTLLTYLRNSLILLSSRLSSYYYLC
jgi:hypothetical protein